MKKILFAVAFIALGFSSCYKEEVIDYHGILTEHTWYMTYKSYNFKVLTRDCELSYELKFDDDSTGRYYSAAPCDSAPAERKFKWYFSHDLRTLHLSEITNSPAVWGVFQVEYLDDQNLRLYGHLGGNTIKETFSYKK
jgi:hypothetical protein